MDCWSFQSIFSTFFARSDFWDVWCRIWQRCKLDFEKRRRLISKKVKNRRKKAGYNPWESDNDRCQIRDWTSQTSDLAKLQLKSDFKKRRRPISKKVKKEVERAGYNLWELWCGPCGARLAPGPKTLRLPRAPICPLDEVFPLINIHTTVGNLPPRGGAARRGGPDSAPGIRVQTQWRQRARFQAPRARMSRPHQLGPRARAYVDPPGQRIHGPDLRCHLL